jgi:hypothetical protein
MKTIGTIAILTAILAWATTGSASIISADCAADGDGALQYSATNWDSGTYTMSIDAGQYWGPGHMIGDFVTDTELDPTVTMHNTIDNDTGFDWTAYHVNVYMNKYFTLASPTVYYPFTTSPGWSGNITVSPAVLVSPGVWEAQVDFVGGSPILDGTGVIDFSYQASFTGTVSFCQEMVPIPEPGILALGLSGLVALVVTRRLRCR